MSGITPKQKTLGLFLTLGCCIASGLWPSCVRAVYEDGANAAFAILAITTARAAMLYGFCLFSGRPVFVSRADILLALRGGFFQALASATMIAALLTLPGPIAITIGFSHTLMLLFFMGWRGETKIDAFTVATTLAALAGLSFVLNVWDVSGQTDTMGITLAFISAVATMSRLYVFGNMTKTRHPAVVGAENFLTALLFIVILMFIMPPTLPATPAGWGWTAAGGLSMAVSTVLLFYAIALLGSFHFSLLFKMEPVFTALFAVLLIGETLEPVQYMGILLVIGSLAAYQYLDHRKTLRDVPKAP